MITANYSGEMNFHPSFTSKKLECELEWDRALQEKKKANRPSSTFKKEKGSSVAKKFYQAGRYKTSTTDKFNQSYCQFMHPNLKAKAMQMSNRNENTSSEEMVIICL